MGIYHAKILSIAFDAQLNNLKFIVFLEYKFKIYICA